MLRFRVLGASFSRFGCSVFEFWVLRFRDLGALFSRFGSPAKTSVPPRSSPLGTFRTEERLRLC